MIPNTFIHLFRISDFDIRILPERALRSIDA